MEFSFNKQPLLRSPAAPYVLGIGGLAVAAYLCFRLDFGISRTSFVFFVVVTFISLFGRAAASIVLSVLAAALLNFFFTPPLFEFRVDTLDESVQLVTFLITSLILTAVVTKRTRVENDLRASEERFRTLIQFSFDVYWETDEHHRFVRQEFAEGLADAPARESEIGKTRWEVPYLEPDEETWRKHRETMDAHLPFRDFELARPTPDGTKRYISVSGLPVFDSTGRFTGYRGVGRHITERKIVEEALRRSEAYLAEAQSLSHTGTIVFNPTSAVYWSEESFRIWALDPKLGLPDRAAVFQRIHPADRERLAAEIEEAFYQRRAFLTEFRILLPDGKLKYIEARGRPLVSADGTRVELIATQFDVTERTRAKEQSEKLRQLEADLSHMNRIGIMGELTASLAHEILHPIATARNNARAGIRFLDMQMPELHEVREALACVVRDADRAKEIVDRVRDHMKKAPPRKQPFDLNEAVAEVIVMVRTAVEREKVTVHLDLQENMSPISGDRVQLQQVLMNLIMNAVESMSANTEEPREMTIKTEQTKDGSTMVAVRDSGPGIDPDRREQLFQPFFTTKETGTGMGLAICRSIIAVHGGRLWADANQPRGAVFQFTLPTADDHDPAGAA